MGVLDGNWKKDAMFSQGAVMVESCRQIYLLLL